MNKFDIEIKKINTAIDIFAEAMKRRMKEKVFEGYEGWDGKYPTEKLIIELNVNAVKILQCQDVDKNCIDMANRGMMIWFRTLCDKETEWKEKA